MPQQLQSELSFPFFPDDAGAENEHFPGVDVAHEDDKSEEWDP
jgi:hypothetical protein